MGLFDDLITTTQKIVCNTMGTPVTWLTGPEQPTDSVLFNDPTDKAGIDGNNYEISRPYIDLLASQFTGLYNLVAEKSQEIILIGTIQYLCTSVKKKNDGKTVIIYLQEIPDQEY